MKRSPEIVEMDSGIKVRFNPVTPRLYRMLMDRYEAGHPRPTPPTIIVHYKGEPDEEMLDLTDPKYQRAIEGWRSGCDAFLTRYFVKNHIEVDIPLDWTGQELRDEGIDVPAPARPIERLLYWLPVIGRRLRLRYQEREAERRLVYLDVVALQTFADITRFNEAILSSAGLYSEGMVAEEEDRFPGQHRRDGTAQVGDKAERGSTVFDLRGPESGNDGGLQPEGMGRGVERAGKGAGGSTLPHNNQTGGRAI